MNLEMARRGAWIEYDGIGGGKSDEFYVDARPCACLMPGSATR